MEASRIARARPLRRTAPAAALAGLLLAGCISALPLAAAQRVVTGPQSIVVNPTPGFRVDVFLDREPSGEQPPMYQVGEPVRIGVEVSTSAYVYLFDISSDGEITQILPNRYDDAGRDNFVRPGRTAYFPPPGARYAFTVEGPRGLSKVFALASEEPLDTRQLARFHDGEPLARSDLGEEGFAQALGIVVRPVPPSGWVTDTALYYVGHQPRQPQFGTISLRSRPSGAEAYVDGDFAGYTPVEYGVRAATHRIELRLDGYQTYTATVDVAAGETRFLDVRLSPVVRPQPPERGERLFDAPALYAPPGVRIVRIERGRHETEARLVTDLDVLYRHLHRQLDQLGWTRRELERDGESVEATYRRRGAELELELEREDRGEVSLELELEEEDDDD